MWRQQQGGNASSKGPLLLTDKNGSGIFNIDSANLPLAKKGKAEESKGEGGTEKKRH